MRRSADTIRSTNPIGSSGSEVGKGMLPNEASGCAPNSVCPMRMPVSPTTYFNLQPPQVLSLSE